MAPPDALKSLEALGVAAVAGSASYLLYSYSKDSLFKDVAVPAEKKYQAGEDYEDPKAIASSLHDDLKAVGITKSRKEIRALIHTVLTKGQPLNDKELTTENLISLLTKLPHESKTRKTLTNKLIDTLWDNLQHPPLSYMGGDMKISSGETPKPDPTVLPRGTIEYDAPNGSCRLRQSAPDIPSGIFQYRTPDGSNNNILNPNLGRAGMPYAKSIRSGKKLNGVRPDPGLLFDLLMGREEGHYEANPSGLSSVLFYHATIIIHDIFRTSRYDQNISDTSSYLDLAPLYGSSLQDQLEIRTMEAGKLKPDTFHEKRLLGQPPGVNVMLVMYSRFHNYVADILLKINEGGRFTVPATRTPEESAKALAKQDNDLFNTARLVVGGLYINICLHDYLRGITNTHHSASTWTLDPRVEIGKQFLDDGTPRGIGNQVSVEFNLLYRFHSAISERDEKWLNGFFESLFPDRKGSLSDLSPQELFQGLVEFEKTLPKDPSKREFGGIERGPDGKFKDEDLVKIMKESIEDPAGSFGARMVPKALKVVEVLGILQARKWQVASLNEFREFFGLKRHEKMTDINPDPEIAKLLEDLYTHPDMVELYPGLFVEEVKPTMATGCGICPPYSVGRAVLSDAVTLVRSDRFNTIDYSVANLTNWGMAEVTQDYETLGGSMFYKLIQRAFPGWFPFNSLHVMQPMFTKEANKKIATEIGMIKHYTEADPARPRPVVVLKHRSACDKVLKDQKSFVVPWTPAVNSLFPGEKKFDWFMLGGDGSENLANRKLVAGVIHGVPNLKETVAKFVATVGASLFKKESFAMTKDLHQLDIIRDVAIPLNARLLADLFYMDLHTAENPQGTLSHSEMYKCLLDIRVWGVNNNDPAMAWNRRRWAQKAAETISKTNKALVTAVAAEKKGRGLFEILASFVSPAYRVRKIALEKGSLRSAGHAIVEGLLAAGKTIEETADICWLTSFGGIGVPVTAFAEIIQYFLREGNEKLWHTVQDLAAANNAKSDKLLREYVLEAQRLTSSQRNLRIATTTTSIDGQHINRGDAVLCLLGEAGRDAKTVKDPLHFRHGRGQDNITFFSMGVHECVGREIAIGFIAGLVKLTAGLKNLRPAPGNMGLIKAIQVGTEKCYLSDNWSHLTFDPTTWKVHFDGYGRGVYVQHPATLERKGEFNLIQVESTLKIEKAEDAHRTMA